MCGQCITWALHVVSCRGIRHHMVVFRRQIALPLDFGISKRGTRVIIARDDVRPFEIRNSHLFVSRSTVSGSPESQNVPQQLQASQSCGDVHTVNIGCRANLPAFQLKSTRGGPRCRQTQSPFS